jgi:hypothetical protein
VQTPVNAASQDANEEFSRNRSPVLKKLTAGLHQHTAQMLHTSFNGATNRGEESVITER